MSIEGSKFLMKDLRPEPSRPIEQIEKEHSDLIERARRELEIIAPSLKDLVAKIEEEKPDSVLFLDKGARILAAPVRKYLHDRMGKNTPKIQRYNDDPLKTPFLENESIDDVVAEDFMPLSGKKVFYVDETFSSGKGAVALDKATSQANVDMKYFALTRATPDPKESPEQATFGPGKFYGLSREDYEKELKRIRNDPRFTIYPNDIQNLFTRDAATLCVVDPDGKTQSRYEFIPEDEASNLYDYTLKRGELPNARRYQNPPVGMNWEEFDKKVREMNMRTVRTLTHMIYEALNQFSDEEKFDFEKSPIREVYVLLNARTPLELNNLYTAEDQKLMTSHEWNYRNPELVVNKVKDILEATDPNTLNQNEQEWRHEILWFWYHHAISCAIWRYKDKNAAQTYATKALEYQSEEHPNKITQLFYFLVNDNLDEAERWASAIEEDPEKTTAAELVDEYKKGSFFS